MTTGTAQQNTWTHTSIISLKYEEQITSLHIFSSSSSVYIHLLLSPKWSRNSPSNLNPQFIFTYFMSKEAGIT